MFFVYIFMYAGVSLTLACNHRRENGCNPWILLSPSCTLSAPDPTRWLLCGSSTMRSLKVGPSPNIIQEVLTFVTTMRFTKTTTTTICFLGDGVENMNTFTSMLCAGLILRPPQQQQQSGKTTLMRWHKLCSSLPSHDLFFVGFRKWGGKKTRKTWCCFAALAAESPSKPPLAWTEFHFNEIKAVFLHCSCWKSQLFASQVTGVVNKNVFFFPPKVIEETIHTYTRPRWPYFVLSSARRTNS